MKKVGSVKRYQAEKMIITALLKISEILKKTHQFSKGDDDRKQYKHDYNAPISPSMRTLESYFNKQHTISSLNYNRTPILLWNSYLDKCYSSRVKKQRILNGYRKKLFLRQMKYPYYISYDHNQYNTSDC